MKHTFHLNQDFTHEDFEFPDEIEAELPDNICDLYEIVKSNDINALLLHYIKTDLDDSFYVNTKIFVYRDYVVMDVYDNDTDELVAQYNMEEEDNNDD